jgi:hypothetical protein
MQEKAKKKGQWRTIKDSAKLFMKLRAKKSSMEEIAAGMGRDVKYLYRILPKIAEVLGVPHDELLFQRKIPVEFQNEETGIEAAETAESGVVDVVAEATEEESTTTEAQATEEEEVETITSTEEVAAPETEVSEEASKEAEEVQEIITNATLAEILNNLAETRRIIESMNIIQEVTK